MPSRSFFAGVAITLYWPVAEARAVGSKIMQANTRQTAALRDLQQSIVLFLIVLDPQPVGMQKTHTRLSGNLYIARRYNYVSSNIIQPRESEGGRVA